MAVSLRLLNEAQRGFNGAAGVNPRIYGGENPTGACQYELQWGRGCEPADISIPRTLHGEITIASMGPRV